MKPYNIQTLSVDINGQEIPVQCFTIRKGNYNYQYAQAEINGEKVEGVSRFTNRNWEEYDYQKAIQNLKNNIGENIVNESKYEGMDDSWSDIAVYAENQREIYDTLWNLKLALQKKMKRGEEINIDVLTNSSIMRKIMQKAIREFNEYNKENDLPVMHLDNEAKQGLRQYFAEKIFDWIEEENINNMNESKLKRIIRQSINEAVNGGWEVETNEAQEAYNLAVNVLGKETIDDAIIRAMGDTQLAEILAYVFRMYDFTEWEEYKNETLEPREPYADFGEMYESMEYEDYTPEISEIAEQCGYSITDSYDKWNGVVYVLDKERKNACSETELKDKILSSIGEVEVKFGKRTSLQAPEMSKLLLYVETPYQEELA